jgi:hypothetical protein
MHIFLLKRRKNHKQGQLKEQLISQYDDDDEEKETLLKRQNRHEGSTMKGSVNLQ